MAGSLASTRSLRRAVRFCTAHLRSRAKKPHPEPQTLDLFRVLSIGRGRSRGPKAAGGRDTVARQKENSFLVRLFLARVSALRKACGLERRFGSIKAPSRSLRALAAKEPSGPHPWVHSLEFQHDCYHAQLPCDRPGSKRSTYKILVINLL
jgi:hypothetical protein